MSLLPQIDAYEIRFVAADGCDRLPLVFASDDEDAKQIAMLLRDHRAMEIWRGPRLVASYPARSVADLLVAPSAGALPKVVSPNSSCVH